MTFRSDPARPGSDAWAMLDDEGARILGPRFVLLRQHMLIIRRWTQRTWKTNRPSSYSHPKQAGHVYARLQEARRRGGRDDYSCSLRGARQRRRAADRPARTGRQSATTVSWRA